MDGGGDLAKALADGRVDWRLKDLLQGKAERPPWFQQFGGKEGLSIRSHEVQSRPDGNAMDVLVVRPEGGKEVPCVLYLHGGGMAAGNPAYPPWSRFARILAQLGVCVALPDFRNYAVPSKPGKAIGKFPAGLNDCMSALEWVNGSKALLGHNGRVVIAGESGGGNLTLALAMKCKKEGKLGLFQAWYALCPYIAGFWPERPGGAGEILGSSHMSSGKLMIDLSHPKLGPSYSQRAFEEKDPLAWPGFAKEADVQGLPPGVISVDECDPLCDEGVNFYRLLLRARVPARCVMNMGVMHGGHLMGIVATPEHSLATARALADVAMGMEALVARL